MSEAFAVNAKKEKTKKLQYYIHTPPPVLKKIIIYFWNRMRSQGHAFILLFIHKKRHHPFSLYQFENKEEE